MHLMLRECAGDKFPKIMNVSVFTDGDDVSAGKIVLVAIVDNGNGGFGFGIVMYWKRM